MYWGLSSILFDSQHNCALTYAIYICITNGSPCTPWRTPTGHFYCSLTIHLCKELEVWGPQIRSVNLRLLYVPLLAKKRGLHGQAFPAKPGMQGLFLQNIWSIFWTPTTKIHHSNSCLQKRQELFFFTSGNGQLSGARKRPQRCKRCQWADWEIWRFEGQGNWITKEQPQKTSKTQ